MKSNSRSCWQFIRAMSIVLMMILAGSMLSWGQLYTGSITGVVQDPSGAVIPNARVTLTDVAKGQTRDFQTDNAGRYLFRSLPPTNYKISVSATGFTTTVLPDITLNVNDNVSANVTLKVGAGSESVEVMAGAEVLQTQDASVGQVVSGKLINELPLVGRQVYDLAFLAPGVSQPTGKAFGPGGEGNNFVSQGSRNAQADILLDGITTTNYEQNTGFTLPMYTPSADAVQEFKIQQTNFSAEYGFSGATLVNVVTKSGSNDFHGTAYEYVRNTLLNSNDYFLEKQGIDTPPYHWNNFGGTIGGPIKKDKIFFFFDYDGSRTITPKNVSLGLPTQAERDGNFGALCSAGFDESGMCSDPSGQLWDPYMIDNTKSNHFSTTYVPFNNLANYTSHGSYWNGSAVVPLTVAQGNLINPVAKNVLQYIPLPNGSGLNNNYTATGSDLNNGNQFDAKVDANITSKDMFNLRFSHRWGNAEQANIFGNAFDSNTQGPNKSVSYQAAANYTHTFTPTTLLTWTFGATHNWSHTQGVQFDSTQIGIPENIASAAADAHGVDLRVAPAFQIDGYAGENGNANFGGQPWAVMLYGQDLAHSMVTMSHVRGKHELKFGGEARLHRINFTQFGLPGGHWQFQKAGTSQDWDNPGTTGGDGMASFMVGWGTGWNSYEVPPSPATQNYQIAWFLQDNWRATSRLTLNLGFRYDIDMPRTERYDRMSYFDPDAPAPIQLTGLSAADLAACPACANLKGKFDYVGGDNPSSPYKTYYGAVGPRLGLAYQPTKSSVIRAGFGIYYSPAKTGAAGAGSGGSGFEGYGVYTTWGAKSDSDGRTPAGRSIMGLPANIGMPNGNTYGTYTQLGGQLSKVPVPTMNKLPREYSWSLGFQQELPWNIVASAEYIGKHGENLYQGGTTYYFDHLSADDAAKFIANPSYYNEVVAMPTPLCNAIKDNTAPWSNPGWGCSWPRFNGLLPFPQYAFGSWGDAGVQTADAPVGRSNYHGFVFRGDKHFSHDLQFFATYTVQRSMDDASIAGDGVWINGIAAATLARIQDPNNLASEYTLSQYDISQIFQATYVYGLPFGKGKRWSASNDLANNVLGNWTISGTYRWDTGLPIIPLLDGGRSLPTYGNQRPNLDAPLVKANGVHLDQYFADPGALSKPAPYVNGTAPRVLDSVRAPGTNTMSMAVSKNFLFGEQMRLQFRWEAFNLFNHVQFAAPNATLGSSNFGQISSQANSPRIQQLSLRFTF